jgi:hypothetical protein
MDVHEVWLSNLQHIKEHQPSTILQQLKTRKQAPSRSQLHEDGDLESSLNNDSILYGEKGISIYICIYIYIYK